MHTHHLSNFFGSLVVAQNQFKHSFEYHQNTKFLMKNIQLLFKEGYIAGYEVKKGVDSKNSTVVIFLKYTTPNNVPLIRSVYFYSTPSRNWTIKYRDLYKLIKKKSKTTVFILSTSYGLHTGLQCLWYKRSGVLLYRIN